MAERVYYATGRRKTAVAKVWVSPGKGEITINDRPMREYLGRDMMALHLTEPLRVTEMEGRVDVRVLCSGGGLSGQAGAVRLGIARALMEMNPDHKSTLRENGLLTRDPRMVERKKYGRPKARKRYQFSKR
jgi:small subunit ribosomal protein S9